MRFKKYERFALTWTTRKAAAAARKLRREQEALPLLADLIREIQPTIEQIRARREDVAAVTDRHFRAFRARQWRQVRAALATIAPLDRCTVRAYWNTHTAFPGDPPYLAYVIRQYAASGLPGLGVCELSTSR